MRLFPTCDPRGVLMRALAEDAPEWSTRPDALVFGWMLALPAGIDSRAAAQGVLDFMRSTERVVEWTPSQRDLLEALTAVAQGRNSQKLPRRRKRR
jgi:hypothetical protein